MARTTAKHCKVHSSAAQILHAAPMRSLTAMKRSPATRATMAATQIDSQIAFSDLDLGRLGARRCSCAPSPRSFLLATSPYPCSTHLSLFSIGSRMLWLFAGAP